MYFAKHETFYIREGWLYKGMAAIQEAENRGTLPTIFLDRYAPEKLGIGRNMVRALRFWMQATGLANEGRMENKTVHTLTEFGQWVWEHDRYFENEATLWLVHYRLVTQKDQASTWYWFFNHFTATTFESEACLQALNSWVITELPDQTIASSSLKKDVDILLRTYLPSEKLITPETLTESPLAGLGLLRDVGSKRNPLYRREAIAPNRLPPLVLLYVLLDQQQQKRPNASQVGLGQVLREPMNAGRVFNLSTATLAELLNTLNKSHPDLAVRFVRTAGLDELDLPAVTPQDILARYAAETNLIAEVA